uniref:Tetratricopeptide repeat domain 29 n=1 Tax=Gopherus evgoodei TaxID=1825980 RepID=A0A8C5EZE2_9SAUR
MLQTSTLGPHSVSLNFFSFKFRIHLIKDKDAIDHYLSMNIKGLSKQEAAAYRNSYKKNICIDMLRQGYHKSFSELFTLIQKWNALREAAGPGSAIWQQKSLEEQPDKLDQLHHFLTRAEAAQRAEYYEEVYNNQLKLAYCFNNTEDKWLRNYFYEQCLSTAQLIKIDGGKKESEAHANMGLVNEEQGKSVHESAEHYETFHQLTLGRMWNDETADQMLENKEHQQAIKTLIKAFEMAKKGGWKITLSHSFLNVQKRESEPSQLILENTDYFSGFLVILIILICWKMSLDSKIYSFLCSEEKK